jgi:hypothetical protein
MWVRGDTQCECETLEGRFMDGFGNVMKVQTGSKFFCSQPLQVPLKKYRVKWKTTGAEKQRESMRSSMPP